VAVGLSVEKWEKERAGEITVPKWVGWSTSLVLLPSSSSDLGRVDGTKLGRMGEVGCVDCGRDKGDMLGDGWGCSSASEWVGSRRPGTVSRKAVVLVDGSMVEIAGVNVHAAREMVKGW
jgi:hypothetical protein